MHCNALEQRHLAVWARALIRANTNVCERVCMWVLLGSEHVRVKVCICLCLLRVCLSLCMSMCMSLCVCVCEIPIVHPRLQTSQIMAYDATLTAYIALASPPNLPPPPPAAALTPPPTYAPSVLAIPSFCVWLCSPEPRTAPTTPLHVHHLLFGKETFSTWIGRCRLLPPLLLLLFPVVIPTLLLPLGYLRRARLQNFIG